MDSDFQERAARVIEHDRTGRGSVSSRRRSFLGYRITGIIVGFVGQYIVLYANANYEKTPEFLPVILAVMCFLAILAVSTVLGLLLLISGRRAIWVFCIGEYLGFAAASIVWIVGHSIA